MSLRMRDLLDAVEWVAGDQHGLITSAQLAEIGIQRSTLGRRVRTGGQWRRVLPATYCVSDEPLTVEQRETAALLFAGDGSVLTGASAMRRWGIKYVPADPALAPVHVVIPIERHRKSAGFAVVERSQRPPTVTNLDGAPCATLARSIVDAARRITDRRTTRAFTLEAIQRGMVDLADLATELRHAQRRGTALLGDCLVEARAGVQSVPEAELRDFVARTNLPTPLWNPRLYRANGEFLAQPDGLIEESMTVLEVESEEHHSKGEDWTNTLGRATRYGAAGLVVVHIVPALMRRNPSETLRIIRESHQYALTRPRPDVIVKPIGTFSDE